MKKRVWITLLCCLLAACAAAGAATAAFASDGEEPQYTKVSFASVERSRNTDDSYATANAASKAIDGDKNSLASVEGWAQTAYFQNNEWLKLAFSEEKTIDRLVVTLPNSATITHTSVWRAEVSADGENWISVNYKAREDNEIINTAVRLKNRADRELIIDFEPVACTYVRLVNLVKELDGTNCLGVLTEVEAFTSGAQAGALPAYRKFAYTAACSDAISGGSIDALNDGQGMYYGQGTNTTALQIWERRSLIFDTKKIVPAMMRIYPNGWEITHGSDGNPVAPAIEGAVNESALINTQVATSLLFEGANNDGNWKTIGEFSNIQPYIFAQDYKFDVTEAYTQIRMTVTGWTGNLTGYGEIELFGTVGGNYVVLKEESNAKKEYTEGEELDLSGFKIAKVTVDQNTGDESEGEAVAVTADMIESDFDPYKIGKQTVVVLYEGMRTMFEVNVSYASVSGTKITLTNPTVNGNYHLTPVVQMNKLIDGDKATEVILGTWGETDYFNVFEPMTFTIADSFLTDGKAAVDKLRVYFKAGNVHTARFMIEASVDGDKWATVNYKASADNVIENNAVGLKLPAHSDYLTAEFEPIYAKYLRVTYLIKNLDGTNALSKLTEIEAYASDGIAVTETPVYAAKQSYTYTAVSADTAGTTSNALNDGKKMYFGMEKEPTEIYKPEVLVLFGGKNDDGETKSDASITFTFENFINPAKIRLFPNGINVRAKQMSAIVNDDALVNTTVPKAFKVEGSADGESWTTLGEYTDVKPYTFAQEFALNGSYTVKYIRLAILNTNDYGGGSDFAEIEIFANAVEDFTYVKEYEMEFNDGKIIYSQNEELDVTDFSVLVSDNAGGVSVQTVPVTAEMVKNFDTSVSGEKSAQIEYHGLTCDFDYVVAEVDGVNISKMPDKTVYFVGEELNTAGMEITVSYHYGEDKTGSVVITKLEKFVTLDTSAANNNAKLTVNYYGKSATADVVVRDVQSISVSSSEHKASYYVGAKLDVSKLEIEVTYTDGNKEVMAVTEDMVSGFTSAKAAEKVTLTITYMNKTATFDVEIKALPGGEENGGGKKGCGCGSDAVGSCLIAGITLLAAATVILAFKRKQGEKQ